MSIRGRWFISLSQADSSRRWSWSIAKSTGYIIVSVLSVLIILLIILSYNAYKRNADLLQLGKNREENRILRDRLEHFTLRMDSLLIKIRIMENWEDELREEKQLRLIEADPQRQDSAEPVTDPVFLNYDFQLHNIYNENLRKLDAVIEKLDMTYNRHRLLMSTMQLRGSAYRNTPSIWPTFGKITSDFGFRNHPVFRYKNLHAGVDIANQRGTLVYATADGIVSHAERSGQSGNLIRINHSRYQTRYAHLDKMLVRKGDFVQKGQIIAFMGNSGVTTGHHLHYEVLDLSRNTVVNPHTFFKLSEEQIVTN